MGSDHAKEREQMFVLLIFLVDLKTRREEQIKAAHDEAIFGAPSHLPRSPSTETDDEAEDGNGKKDISEIAPATSLISGQAVAMQQGSWRDRVRNS
ncbi:hypothetical protein H5410_061633 [Solanum commersonii]|uniref:Uncharacterized protein n=1 Tax=Solanum commersonii TaxID=4109 RepID=A0A9J5W891_SOLCO|nr:hypothetical protein H5410_061633 [Solanum commersonii]